MNHDHGLRPVHYVIVVAELYGNGQEYRSGAPIRSRGVTAADWLRAKRRISLLVGLDLDAETSSSSTAVPDVWLCCDSCIVMHVSSRVGLARGGACLP